jgi:hypothetical protein
VCVCENPLREGLGVLFGMAYLYQLVLSSLFFFYNILC